MLLSQKESKLDPRVKRTRKLLQQSFAELLAERDFQSVTVHDIAERAEVNRATFYAHFEDKYALLSYSVREALQDLLKERLPDMHTFTVANLRLLALTVCEFMGHFYGNCHPGTGTRNDEQMLIAAQVQDQVYEVLLEWLTQAQANSTGRGGQSISPQSAASVVSWILFGAGIDSMRPDRKRPFEQVVDDMLSVLAPSLQIYAATAIA